MTQNAQSLNAATSDSGRPPPSAGGALYAAGVGLPIAMVLGWTLLSWALSLPFMLGVFFFMLFGLFIGAAMFRVASRSAPLTKSSVVAATCLASLVCWATAMFKECRDFPADFVNGAIKRVYIPQGRTQALRGELATFIEVYLKEKYPPGGALGYLKLAASGRPIIIDNLPSGQPRPVVIPPRASAFTWWIRNLLALVLAYVAIYSVTGGLVPSNKRPAVEDDASEPADDAGEDSQAARAQENGDGHKASPLIATEHTR